MSVPGKVGVDDDDNNQASKAAHTSTDYIRQFVNLLDPGGQNFGLELKSGAGEGKGGTYSSFHKFFLFVNWCGQW